MKSDRWFTRYLMVLCFLLWLGTVAVLPVHLWFEPVATWKLPFLFVLWTMIVAVGVRSIQDLREADNDVGAIGFLAQHRLFDPNLTRTVPTRVPLQHGASAVSPEGTRITVEAVDD